MGVSMMTNMEFCWMVREVFIRMPKSHSTSYFLLVLLHLWFLFFLLAFFSGWGSFPGTLPHSTVQKYIAKWTLWFLDIQYPWSVAVFCIALGEGLRSEVIAFLTMYWEELFASTICPAFDPSSSRNKVSRASKLIVALLIIPIFMYHWFAIVST